jgi:hypothetical protein
MSLFLIPERIPCANRFRPWGRLWLTLLICILCFVATPKNASAQTPQELQRELEQRKKDYETRIAGLEQRIAQLEASPAVANVAKPVEPATSSAAQSAAATPPAATAQTTPEVTQKPGQNLWRVVSIERTGKGRTHTGFLNISSSSRMSIGPWCPCLSISCTNMEHLGKVQTNGFFRCGTDL